MKKIIKISILLIALIILASCDIKKVHLYGDGNYSKLELKEFNNETVYSLNIKNLSLNNEVVKISFVDGDSPKISMRSDDNILKSLKLSIVKGVIEIVGNKNYDYYTDKFEIEIVNIKFKSFDFETAVSLTDTIGNFSAKLEIKVAGVLDGEMNLEKVTDTLDLRANGVIKLVLNNLNSKNMNLDLKGTIDFDANGKVDSLKLESNGLINLNLKELAVVNSEINLLGTSNAVFTVSNDFFLTVNGLGSISYHGDPTNTKILQDGLVVITKK